MRPGEVDEQPLPLIGWMTQQLVEYDHDPKEWFKADGGGIGFDDLGGGDASGRVRWRVQGADLLPFDDE